MSRMAADLGVSDDTDADRSRASAWQELMALHHRVSCAVERELQENHGIGVSEFEALELMVAGGKDKYRAQEITDALPITQSAASRLVARLEKQGLVCRSMCELDRRGIFVLLTNAGRQRYEAARPTQRAILAQMLPPPPL